MKIKKIHIQNYKSLVDLEIIEPNPFTVFAGPNGAGKSNIFEALEFIHNFYILGFELTQRMFGSIDTLKSYRSEKNTLKFEIKFISDSIKGTGDYNRNEETPFSILEEGEKDDRDINDYRFGYSRLFINKQLDRISISTLDLDFNASNLESALKKALKKENAHEFIEWVRLFVPGVENIQVNYDSIGGTDTLLIFEKASNKPFPKSLISDGTYNILSLLTAVYQTDKPQFLCIEEPENGLNPYVIRTLVDFFRKQCAEKGHYIWLNTHSQTLVKYLQPEELILVDKIDGETKIKQFPKDYNLHGLELDEAWLSNALGGGVPC